ncbi:MAG TPA: glutathione S-transferase N-terminal domain-containing protein [Solirubrobacteraceae bacterium]
MTAELYWFALSHPAQASRKALQLKGIEFESVNVMPGMQRVHLRLAGFHDGTVPAIKLDGRRVQGSIAIARALEQVTPDPPLFPREEKLRGRVEAAEAWGERELQPVPRRIIRWGIVNDMGLRRWLATESGLPAPALAARTGGPAARYYARAVGANEAAVRRDLEQLPALLDRADELLADETLDLDRPNAATLQVLASVRALDGFADLADEVRDRPSAAAARELFPAFSADLPAFIPDGWR